MAAKILSSEEAETFLAKVFDILDSYDYDRFSEVLAADLQYQGGLQTSSGLDNFINDIKESVKKIPGMKTSHTRYKNDITREGTIYSSGYSTALFQTHPDKPVTIPMIGVFELATDGKIKEMKIYKDRLPFVALQRELPGMKAN